MYFISFKMRKSLLKSKNLEVFFYEKIKSVRVNIYQYLHCKKVKRRELKQFVIV